jgi:hypothetical protein
LVGKAIFSGGFLFSNLFSFRIKIKNGAQSRFLKKGLNLENRPVAKKACQKGLAKSFTKPFRGLADLRQDPLPFMAHRIVRLAAAAITPKGFSNNPGAFFAYDLGNGKKPKGNSPTHEGILSQADVLAQEPGKTFVSAVRTKAREKGRSGLTSLGLGLEFVAFFTLFAQFPNNALRAKLAVGAWIGAGLAVVQALFAIADHHFLAAYLCLAFRVVAAVHLEPSSLSGSLIIRSTKRAAYW